MIQVERRSLAVKVTTALASGLVYLPIVAGIITPMMYLLPAWYVSWYVAALIFPFSESWHGFIDPMSEMAYATVIWAVEIVAFVAGLSLFLWGLFEMTRQLKRGVELIDSGPYAHIRHPQHLGILIMLLPFAFSFELTHWYSTGVRPGDILSWTLMAFLLLAVADFEESRLVNSLDGYVEYRSRTPFIIPFTPRLKLGLPARLQQGRPARYLILFIVYWICMSLVLFGLVQLPMVFTR